MNNYGKVKLVSNITGVFCLLGLTWVFGALTITKADQAFQIMFTVTNSLQEFFIFILFCVLNGDVRAAWAKSLPCKCRTTMTSSKSQESSKPQSTVGLTLSSHNHTQLGSECSAVVESKDTYSHVKEQVELNNIVVNGSEMYKSPADIISADS